MTRLFLLIAALVLILITPLFIWGDAIDEKFAGERGVAYLRQYGVWAVVVGIGLIISDLVAPVPTPAVMAAMGMLYGPFLGGLCAAAGSFLAGMVAYGSCRLLGPRAARFLVGESNLLRLDRFFQRHGLWAVVLSRSLPLLPEILCCLAGLARMPLSRFAAALGCGSLAMGIVFASLGQFYSDQPVVGLILSAVIPLAAWPLVHRLLKHPPADPNVTLDPAASKLGS